MARRRPQRDAQRARPDAVKTPNNSSAGPYLRLGRRCTAGESARRALGGLSGGWHADVIGCSSSGGASSRVRVQAVAVACRSGDGGGRVGWSILCRVYSGTKSTTLTRSAITNATVKLLDIGIRSADHRRPSPDLQRRSPPAQAKRTETRRQTARRVADHPVSAMPLRLPPATAPRDTNLLPVCRKRHGSSAAFVIPTRRSADTST